MTPSLYVCFEEEVAYCFKEIASNHFTFISCAYIDSLCKEYPPFGPRSRVSSRRGFCAVAHLA